jgi:hypothetical protein
MMPWFGEAGKQETGSRRVLIPPSPTTAQGRGRLGKFHNSAAVAPWDRFVDRRFKLCRGRIPVLPH